eukprot:Clim_evm53s55 gene=Clim_evmTU53s55
MVAQVNGRPNGHWEDPGPSTSKRQFPLAHTTKSPDSPMVPQEPPSPLLRSFANNFENVKDIDPINGRSQDLEGSQYNVVHEEPNHFVLERKTSLYADIGGPSYKMVPKYRPPAGEDGSLLFKEFDKDEAENTAVQSLERMDSISRDTSAFEDESWTQMATDIVSHWMTSLLDSLLPHRVQLRRLREKLRNAQSYDEYCQIGKQVDKLTGNAKWKWEYESNQYNNRLIFNRLNELREARKAEDNGLMLHLLRAGLKRNIGGILNTRLYTQTCVGTKVLIEQYISEVVHQLEYLAVHDIGGMSPSDKLSVFENTRHAYGRTALILSGGGAMALYHLGVVKALLDANVLPRIICGSSGGAILGAMVATRSDSAAQKLFEKDGFDYQMFNPDGETYSLARKWLSLLTSGYLGTPEHLQTSMRKNLGDLTFKEAYNLTGRILNVSINSSHGYEGPRLLNYITAPDVLVWSGVCASCAAPGLFPPVNLMAKDSKGNIVSWNESGGKWSDGSVEADIPLQRLAELFNVNHSIVVQINPHINPVLRTSVLPEAVSKLLAMEGVHRLQQLKELGGPSTLADITNQNYTGDVTLIPNMRLWDYCKVLSNPDWERVQAGVRIGQQEAFQKMTQIKTHLEVEMALDRIVLDLRRRALPAFGKTSDPEPIQVPPMQLMDPTTSFRRGVDFQIPPGLNASLDNKSPSPRQQGQSQMRQTMPAAPINSPREEKVNGDNNAKRRTSRTHVFIPLRRTSTTPRHQSVNSATLSNKSN